MRYRWLVVIAVLGATRPAYAQRDVRPASEWASYLRLLEIEGRASRFPLLFHSLSSWQHIEISGDGGPWVSSETASDSVIRRRHLRAVPLEVGAVYNSRFPSGTNDGALWAGRGVSVSATGGIAARWAGLTLWAYPTVVAEQNRAFDIIPVTTPGFSSYSYPWNPGRIDLPQRFGNSARSRLDWGQSGIRADWRALTLGVSNENLVWGPAVQNPIVMSSGAPGFPHLDLGTGHPVRTPIGRVEARLVWGRLSESDFFDTVATNNTRLFTGFTLGIAPRWLPELTVGLTRMLYMYWDDSLRAADFLDVFQPFFKNAFRTPTNPTGDDDRDQMLSLTARWVLPRSGFEAYIEWSRNDHNVNTRDFLLEPFHSEAFTLGFQKSVASGHGRARLRGELTSLGRSSSFQVRATPTYYTHHIVVQGYTHQGQVIGAGIGPGSESQYLGFDRYIARGRWGLFFQRVAYNEDAYYTLFGAARRREGHNVHLTGGASVMRSVGRFELGLNVALTHEFNRHYVIKTDATNLNVSGTVGWRPRD